VRNRSLSGIRIRIPTIPKIRFQRNKGPLFDTQGRKNRDYLVKSCYLKLLAPVFSATADYENNYPAEYDTEGKNEKVTPGPNLQEFHYDLPAFHAGGLLHYRRTTVFEFRR
jgi:hypothetical protein